MDKTDAQLESQHFRYCLGALVREKRKAKGLTQAEFAQSIGISRNLVVGIERGKTDSTKTTLAMIASELGMTLAELFEQASTMTKLLS